MSDTTIVQVQCPYCQGGNPPSASICMWCHQPMNTAPPDAQTYAEGDHASNSTSGRPSMMSMLLNEEQDPAVVEQVKSKVAQILTKGEEIQYIAVQRKPGVNLAPDCVVLTNKRFIIYRPKMFGRVEFEDYIWRNLYDARIKENILGATFSITTKEEKRELHLEYLPKAQARRLYQFAQEMEEYVKEELRYRDIEMQRAGAAGIYMNVPQPPMPGQPFQSAPPVQTVPPAHEAQQLQEDPVEKLKQLKQMLDNELISRELYDAKRDEIVKRM